MDNCEKHGHFGILLKYVKDFWLTSLNSQPSRSLSSSTLLRGAGLLRSATMSIESDPLMAEMQKELEKLKVPSHSIKAKDF